MGGQSHTLSPFLSATMQQAVQVKQRGSVGCGSLPPSLPNSPSRSRRAVVAAPPPSQQLCECAECSCGAQPAEAGLSPLASPSMSSVVFVCDFFPIQPTQKLFLRSLEALEGFLASSNMGHSYKALVPVLRAHVKKHRSFAFMRNAAGVTTCWALGRPWWEKLWWPQPQFSQDCS